MERLAIPSSQKSGSVANSRQHVWHNDPIQQHKRWSNGSYMDGICSRSGWLKLHGDGMGTVERLDGKCWLNLAYYLISDSRHG
jgi:hypothetical protein